MVNLLLSEQPIGAVVTIGHPANLNLAVHCGDRQWRFLHNGKLVDPEDFRAGWKVYRTTPKPTLTETLGETVRVYYTGDEHPIATGKLIAIIPEPVLVIEDEDGARHYHPSSLRREVQHSEWLPA